METNNSEPNELQIAALNKLIERFRKEPDQKYLGIVGEPNVLMVRWDNLWIGIETDGYAHS